MRRVRILALDSTAKVCTAALCEDTKLVTMKRENAGMTHSEMLLPMIESILSDAGLTCADIDVFALSKGPGSFTGVRIGAATVKGLCFGREAACVGVSTLLALAYNFIDSDGIVVSCMDARRSQVYTAIFRVRDKEIERLSDDMAISIDELARKVCEYSSEKIYLSGDGAALVYNKLKENPSLCVELDEEKAAQNAYSVAQCAYRAYLAGESVSDSELRPTYLRLAQAERERLEKLGQLPKE